MVTNPNSVLTAALQGQTMKSRTFIQISTKHTPVKGGGTANTAFLASAANPPGGNANAVEIDADLLDPDDRRQRRRPGQATASVHAAGPAQLQRTDLAARDGVHAGETVSRVLRTFTFSSNQLDIAPVSTYIPAGVSELVTHTVGPPV